MQPQAPASQDKIAGHLKIVLGYAAGVGKTFKMLDEGQVLKAAGHDVVIGYFEPHARPDTIAKTEGLEMVPRRKIPYRDREFEEMDTEAILTRRPEICLVDEFPHTNVPGSSRAKRWEDVLVLLDSGVNVITTMNVQHIESLNDKIQEITGVQVRETVPDWVLKRADEIVLVDLTPGALLNRLDRGVVYSREKAQKAKENFFKEPTLAVLREMALRQAAHEVDLRQNDVGPSKFGASPVRDGDYLNSHEPRERERILIHVTDSLSTVALIRRGRRVADYLMADCFAVAVIPGPDMTALPAAKREALERHLEFARKLHIDTRVLDADDPAEALAGFAHTNGITQVFVAKPGRQSAFHRLAGRPIAMKLIRLAPDIQVTVVADRGARSVQAS